MILKQFYLGCLAHASYLVGDEETRTALVVDPQRDVEQYIAFAAEHGLKMTGVVLTHLHADFLAGHLEIRNRTGATIYLGRAAQVEYACTGLADGDVIDLGSVRVRALETPGHTPESISLVIYDRHVSDSQPRAVLTGDTLFVGDVGRPDLLAAPGWSAKELGGMLYGSLHDKLLRLPDDTVVYPAHGAGSLCGRALGKETFSTIGEQRLSNYALQPMSRTAFVDLVTADLPDAPPYFTYDAVMNTKERPTLEESLERELAPLSIDRVLDQQAHGAQLLDTRDPVEFAAAHLTGSLNVGLGGQYATWAGTVLDPRRPVVIVAEPGAERESAMRLGRIGFDQTIGYLDGGLRSANNRPDHITSTDRLGPEVAASRLRGANPPLALDVRTPGERQQKWIAGSLHIPLNHLVERLSEIPARPLLVYCAGGFRSSIAASLLAQRGFTSVAEIAGGIAAWETGKLPVETAEFQSAHHQTRET